MSNRHQRRLQSALGFAFALLLFGCAGGEDGTPLATQQTPTPTGERPATDEPPSPTPTPTPSGDRTPSPEPTPTPSPLSVSVLPASAQIWLPSSESIGEALDKPTTVQLTATVSMSDGSKQNKVSWRSRAPRIADVDAAGLVTAIGAGEGDGPWLVAIEAVAPDGKTVGTRHVSVHAEGGVAVIIR